MEAGRAPPTPLYCDPAELVDMDAAIARERAPSLPAEESLENGIDDVDVGEGGSSPKVNDIPARNNAAAKAGGER